MDYQCVLYEKKDAVAAITLNRPERLNALNRQLHSDFDAAIHEAGEDDEVKVIVVKGAGRAFCAGADLIEQAPFVSVTAQRDLEASGRRRWSYLWDLPKVSIAQIHGYCLAAGIELAMCCDLVIAAEDAQFGYPIARGGAAAVTGGMFSWLVGLRKTKELCLTGDLIDAREAERLGLINKAVPGDKLQEEVEKLAGKIIRIPADVLALSKTGINKAFEIMGIRTALDWAQDLHVIGHGADSALAFAKMVKEEGLRTALQKRDSSAT